MFTFTVGVIIGLETCFNIVQSGLLVPNLCCRKWIDTIDNLFARPVRYDIRRCTLFRKVYCSAKKKYSVNVYIIGSVTSSKYRCVVFRRHVTLRDISIKYMLLLQEFRKVLAMYIVFHRRSFIYISSSFDIEHYGCFLYGRFSHLCTCRLCILEHLRS